MYYYNYHFCLDVQKQTDRQNTELVQADNSPPVTDAEMVTKNVLVRLTFTMLS